MTEFVVATLVVLALTPAVIVLARRWSLIDRPNHRSSHSTPVPRGGGIAVALSAIVAIAVAAVWTDRLVGLVVGSVILAVVGLIDDVRGGLPASSRLAVQVLTPLVIALVVIDASWWLMVASALVAGAAVAGYVNAFNFMDGINGISGMQAVVAGLFLASIASSADLPDVRSAGLAASGAGLGFLPFNAWRPRIFLGDVGSYFLGFWLAGSALLVVDAGVSPLVAAGPFLLYLGDTATVLVRRARRGESLTTAHREHAYQRLVLAGSSHLVVAMGCAAVSGLCAFIMYSVLDRSTVLVWVGFGGCVAIVAGYLVLPSRLEARPTVAEGAIS